MKVGELEITDELHLLFSSGQYSALYLTELALLVVPIILFALKRVRHSRGWSLTGTAFVLAGSF